MRWRDDLGRWEGRITVAGQRRSVYGGSEAEVEDELDRLRDQARRGVGSHCTVGEYLDQWLAEVVAPARAVDTLAGYESAVRLHIKPAVGAVRLERLTAGQVHAMIHGLECKGLSPRTREWVLGTLRSALATAERWQMVDRNVAALVEAPQVRNADTGRPLSVDEARRLLAAARGHRLEALYVVVLPLGLRQGQALALTRDDVDLAARRLRAGHTLKRTAGPVWVRAPIGANKGGGGVLPMPRLCVDALAAHLERQDLERAWAGDLWRPATVVTDGVTGDVDLLFCRGDGQPLHRRSLLADFHRLCDTAGVERRRFHDLRHSAGSMLIALGVHQRVVMATLRHSTTAMSERYTQGVDPLVEAAVEQMGELLAGDGITPDVTP